MAEENKKKMESVRQEMQEESRKMEELNGILRAAEKRFEEIKEKMNQVEDITNPIKVATLPYFNFCLNGGRMVFPDRFKAYFRK